jgi:CRP-like cAMP-binding protein
MAERRAFGIDQAPHPLALALARRLRDEARLADPALAWLREAAERPNPRAATGAALFDIDDPERPAMILSGWAAQQRILANGARQICRLVLPGDLLGLRTSPARADWPVVALTPVTLLDLSGLAPGAPSGAAAPGLLALLARDEDRALLNQVLRLGALSALQRTAHLVLDLHERLSRVGLVAADIFAMPLTQEMLGATLGLSVVHVNRMLQTLRRDGALSLRCGVVKILDRPLLEKTACWPRAEPEAAAPARPLRPAPHSPGLAQALS